jgi:hypothetical protein
MSQPESIDITKIQFPENMDLRSAALFLGLSEMRVRALARKGDIKATKNDDGHWVFSKAMLTQFKNTPRARGGGGPRGDGKAWIIRVKYADLEKVKTFLKSLGIELQPRYNYEKQKAYRAKRAASQKDAPKVAPAAQAKPQGPIGH